MSYKCNTCKYCKNLFHACSGCDLRDYEYEYCSEKCYSDSGVKRQRLLGAYRTYQLLKERQMEDSLELLINGDSTFSNELERLYKLNTE
jgi:hypothetical protein